jgi:hypothetical protein
MYNVFVLFIYIMIIQLSSNQNTRKHKHFCETRLVQTADNLGSDYERDFYDLIIKKQLLKTMKSFPGVPIMKESIY